jgi:hypothetical protein
VAGFLHSDISADSENGKVSFTLVDLDNDGKRDLIIDSYIGGTGLFSYTGVLRRGIIRLIPSITAIPMTTMISTLAYPGAVFPQRRGANQWNQWVRINGQVYALWYNGQFGEDNLYLLRPFSPTDRSPAVTIRYRYRLETLSSPEKIGR